MSQDARQSLAQNLHIVYTCLRNSNLMENNCNILNPCLREKNRINKEAIKIPPSEKMDHSVAKQRPNMEIKHEGGRRFNGILLQKIAHISESKRPPKARAWVFVFSST